MGLYNDNTKKTRPQDSQAWGLDYSQKIKQEA